MNCGTHNILKGINARERWPVVKPVMADVISGPKNQLSIRHIAGRITENRSLSGAVAGIAVVAATSPGRGDDGCGGDDYLSDCFLRRSRISVSRISSFVGSGTGAGASSSFFLNFMITRRAMKMESAMMKKSTMFWMNRP